MNLIRYPARACVCVCVCAYKGKTSIFNSFLFEKDYLYLALVVCFEIY